MEWTIIISLVAVITAVATGASVVLTVRSDNRVLKERLDGVERNLFKLDQLLSKTNELLVAVAESKGRMDRIDDRAVELRRDFEEIRARLAEWTNINGIYETRHRDLEDRLKRLELVCRRLPADSN